MTKDPSRAYAGCYDMTEIDKEDLRFLLAALIVILLLPYVLVGFISYTDWAVRTALTLWGK